MSLWPPCRLLGSFPRHRAAVVAYSRRCRGLTPHGVAHTAGAGTTRRRWSHPLFAAVAFLLPSMSLPDCPLDAIGVVVAHSPSLLPTRCRRRQRRQCCTIVDSSPNRRRRRRRLLAHSMPSEPSASFTVVYSSPLPKTPKSQIPILAVAHSQDWWFVSFFFSFTFI